MAQQFVLHTAHQEREKLVAALGLVGIAEVRREAVQPEESASRSGSARRPLLVQMLRICVVRERQEQPKLATLIQTNAGAAT